MGRLPTHYSGRRITYRVPYTMYSEVFLTGVYTTSPEILITAFPDQDFAFDADKPFEIHRVIPWGTLMTSGEGFDEHPQLTPQLVMLTAEIFIRDNAKNASLMKDFSSANNLVRGPSHQTWEWEDPYYMTRGEGFRVDIRSVPATPTGVDPDAISTGRHMLAFQGFLIAVDDEEG